MIVDPSRPPVQEQGQLLLRRIRAGLTLRGTTMRRWCLENGVNPNWAHQAASGKRRGPAARALTERLSQAAGCHQ